MSTPGLRKPIRSFQVRSAMNHAKRPPKAHTKADVVASHPGADECVSRQIARSHPVTGQEEREPQDVLVIAFVDQPEGIHRASVTIRATAREVTKPLVRP
jgi:hypothetical protein